MFDRRAFAIACGMFAACGLQKQPSAPSGPLPAPAFRVTWERIEAPAVFPAGARKRVIVKLKNSSDTVWPDKEIGDRAALSGAYAVRLSYRWPGHTAGFMERADLPFPILPNQSIEIPISVQAPPHVGSYRLQFDLVQENVAWFGDHGNARPVAMIRVQ